jgi:response regulator RpfG family c-di-GMP phosphodiesterase
MTKKKYKVLFVDDEESILSSLERLFYNQDEIRIFTATSGPAGLNILEKNPDIYLVVTDQKMPEMNGSTFLTKVKEKYPDILRILLTGYSDINDAIEAINKGGIYRYITKPWNAEDLLMTIKNSLKYASLEKKNKEMTRIILDQNNELRALNDNLEIKIQERTHELQKALNTIHKKNDVLIHNFHEVVIFLTNLLSHYNHFMSGHCKRVAETSKKICEKMDLDNEEMQNIIYAGYFHDIGLLGISDDFYSKNFEALTQSELHLYYEHPYLGEKLISTFKSFHKVSQIIKHHHEKYNGKGFPYHLTSENIPLGSRILLLANDYDHYIFIKNKSIKETIELMHKNKDGDYDPEILKLFLEVIKKDEDKYCGKLKTININQLKKGMLLMGDIILTNNVLLFQRGCVVNKAILDRINKFQTLLDLNQEINVII